MFTDRTQLGGVFLVLVAFLVGQNCTWGGSVIVSGDSTPIYCLTNLHPDDALPGNQAFFANVLGDGTNVAVYRSGYESYGPRELSSYYNSLSGVSTTVLNGTMTGADLELVDLLFILTPSRFFSTSEVSVIDGYIQRGGSLFVMGEGSEISFGSSCNEHLNHLLAGLNISVRIDDNNFDIGYQYASGADLSLSAGIDGFRYGAASTVTGGTPLFYLKNGDPFMTVIPEPCTLLLFGIGSLVIVRGRRTGRVGAA